MLFLITGKAGAGKTHYSNQLAKELKDAGKKVFVLDGDVFRAQMKNDDFTDEGRIANLEEAAKIGTKKEEEGYIVIMAFIAPMQKWRDVICSYFKEYRVIYIPGGKLWEGTEYEVPSGYGLDQVEQAGGWATPSKDPKRVSVLVDSCVKKGEE